MRPLLPVLFTPQSERRHIHMCTITVFDDRTMAFRVVGMPTDDRIRAELGIQKGSGKPNSEKVSKKLSQAQLTKIAEEKAHDMNAEDVEAIKKMVAGTARSMGVEVEA